MTPSIKYSQGVDATSCRAVYAQQRGDMRMVVLLGLRPTHSLPLPPYA
jgi:hypothetical protein